MLSPAALERLLEGTARLARGDEGRGPSEWTVEANPDSLGLDALEAMTRQGVTRLSIGVQSLDPDELALLGRRHGPDAALEAVRNAAASGLSVSADLIAGIPVLKPGLRSPAEADRLALFASDLVEAGAAHISAYDLSLEEGSPLAASRSRLLFPTEDEVWEARQRLEAGLRGAGMRRYEVANYAAIDRECRHNLAYWRMNSYIGAGPGAVSTIAAVTGASLRIEEPRELAGYFHARKARETAIGFRDAAFESIMMAFRTSFGLDMASFRARFGFEADEIIGGTLSKWSDTVVDGEPWPGNAESSGPALKGGGLDILNRFLVDCLGEIDSNMPKVLEGRY